jgi:acyl carrier protein
LNKARITRSEDEIRDWLVANLADIIGISPGELDVRKQLDYYGIDSMQAIGISCGLEEWLDRPLSPTIVWDYPTVELLCEYLSNIEH